jgi:hypothetical protein
LLCSLHLPQLLLQVIQCVLQGFDVVFAPLISSYGSATATLEHSPGTCVSVFILLCCLLHIPITMLQVIKCVLQDLDVVFAPLISSYGSATLTPLFIPLGRLLHAFALAAGDPVRAARL